MARPSAVVAVNVLVILETASVGHEVEVSDSISLASVLGVALLAELGGDSIRYASLGAEAVRVSIAIQDVSMILVAALATSRLYGKRMTKPLD